MPELITDEVAFHAVLEQAAAHDRYAIDTEFHREKTYFPQVALVQLAWADQVALIDPLAVDLGPMAELLDSDSVCVMHAGTQDLEVLDLACGTVPTTLFDTQVAAGFLGIATGSLASLLDIYLGVQLAKGDRLTDWLQRPLTNDQLAYAAGDVDNLLDLAGLLEGRLADLGRLEWALSECELVRTKPRGRRAPEDAVHRIKEARSLKGKTARVAKAIAAWRENRAAEANVPVRQILPDIAVVGIAQQTPKSVRDLERIRGLDGRHLRAGAADELLAAVGEGLRATDDAPKVREPSLSKDLRPVVTLVTAWISQLARDHQLDPALLATRSDVEGLLADNPASRLHEGWRAAMVGEPIRQLARGDAALAFIGDGRLTLEARSHQPLH
ncbi:MAG: HRDC domain-containing protein [Acidimicrobiales bacterium]